MCRFSGGFVRPPKCLLNFSACVSISDIDSTKMSSPSAGKRRMDTDVIKLIESKHEVTILSGLDEFVVKFFGPKGTPYEGGVWKVKVHLPEQYPFKSPSIGFMNKVSSSSFFCVLRNLLIHTKSYRLLSRRLIHLQANALFVAFIYY